MPNSQPVSETVALDLARECLYRFLSAALGDPHGWGWRQVLDDESQQLAREAGDLLRAEFADADVTLGFGELPAEMLDLRPVVAELRRPIAELRAEYDRVFGLVIPKECPPYETEYYPTSQTFQRSQQLADIAGFYRAFGIEPGPASRERQDHVSLELEFMAFMLMKKRLATVSGEEDSAAIEQGSVCEDAERNFFRDHLAWWLPVFAKGLGRKASSGLYAALAYVIAALVPAERQRLGVEIPVKRVQPEIIERPEEQSGCAACPIEM